MLMPAEAPGTPIFNSYVGCSVASSKPTEALTTPGVFAPKTFSEVWCVEMMVTHPMWRKCSAMATASAAPSSGIGGRAEFVEQDQGLRGRSARYEINVGDVCGEGRKVLLDGLIVANVGQHRVKYGQLRAVGWDGNPGLRHQRQQAQRFSGRPSCRRYSGR